MSSIAEFRSSIPLNPARPGDGSGFLPIYDPESIALARKFNRLVTGIVVTVGALVLLPLIVFVAYTLGHSDSEFFSGSVGTGIIPLMLIMLSVLLLILISRKAGVRVDRAYEHTQRELEGWLKLQTGHEFGGPEKIEKSDIAEATILTALFGPILASLWFEGSRKHDSRSSTAGAAERISIDEPTESDQLIQVYDHVLNPYYLKRSEDGIYRLTSAV